jgi:transposase
MSKDTIKLLERIHKSSRHHQVRQRAQCCLLSHEGYSINQLASIFKVTRLTITNWLNDWDKFALVGLYDRQGRGRKPKLTPEQQQQVKAWAKETPKNLDLVQNKIESKWKTQVSKDTIKRILIFLGLTWRRIKKQVAGQPDPLIYKAKREELSELKKRDRAGEIDLRYVDETGFCLEPYVPYAWQESGVGADGFPVHATDPSKGEQIMVDSQISKRLNAFGILNRRQELEVFLFEGTINSDVVIACIDRFSEKIKIETVLVIDNASIHTSNAFLDKQSEWEEKGLTIFFLPTYSPELNVIEILWRFIKYQWMEIDAYKSWSSLVDAVENIFIKFGSEYKINFA